MLNRIMELKYVIPPFLSAPCADLVRRLLDPNPDTRITIPEIIKHPWHKIGLPPTAANMNDVYMQVSPDSTSTCIVSLVISKCVMSVCAVSQSEEDINYIVSMAMTLPPDTATTGKDLAVEFIDAVIKEEDLAIAKLQANA